MKISADLRGGLDGTALCSEPGSGPKARQLDIMLDGSWLAGCLHAGVCLLPTLAEELHTSDNDDWQVVEDLALCCMTVRIQDQR